MPRWSFLAIDSGTSPSSSGLGHRPFTPVTGVRLPVGTPIISNSYIQNTTSPCVCGHKTGRNSCEFYDFSRHHAPSHYLILLLFNFFVWHFCQNKDARDQSLSSPYSKYGSSGFCIPPKDVFLLESVSRRSVQKLMFSCGNDHLYRDSKYCRGAYIQ
jgi:hypothetical protein